MSATVIKPPPIGSDGVAPDPRTDPISAYRYLDARRDLKVAEARQRPLIRLWDKSMRYIGTVANEKSVNVEQLLHDTGTGTIELFASDWLTKFLRTDVRAEEDLHVTIDPYPNNRNWRWRYGAKVTSVIVKRNDDGIKTVVLQCMENREHWKRLLFGATPFMPPEVQPIKAWLMFANTRTAITTTAFINLARIFWPILALPSNIANPGSWIGQISGIGNLNPLNWPLQIAFVNPALDQSRLAVLMSRWSYAHDVTIAMLKDAGCDVRAYTWLTEDEDSPHPELAALVGDQLARPTRNCVVLACNDDSGVTGITGTAIDGAINLIAATGDDLITTVLYEAIGDNSVIDPITNTPAPPLIRKLLGAAPVLPSVRFRDTEYSAIKSSEHAMYKAKAKHIMTGGRSPGWVNQAQTFAIRWGLSQLAQAMTTIPGAPAQTPGIEGLDNIYQGQADDILLPYIRFTDAIRDFRVGEYGYLEHLESGSGSAYTVSSFMTLRQGHYKTRPYQAFRVQVLNGFPNYLYYDFDLGTRTLFEIDHLLYSEQITAIRLHYDANTPKLFDLVIGDDSELEDPVSRVSRTVETLWSAVAMALGSADLF